MPTPFSASMTGRVCLVTGANAGIGRATALGLARAGATVVALCRDRARGEETVAAIRRESGNSAVSLLLADLRSREAIARAAAECAARFPALHVLVNNAAVIPRRRTVTDENLEAQFAVNHLAYFRLTRALHDMLVAGRPARIINVSSRAHRRARIAFDDLQSERSYRHRRVYAATKLANVLFTYELARRLDGSGVTANCLHPGLIATSLACDFTCAPRQLLFLGRFIGRPGSGARTSLYLATSPEVAEVSGHYFARCRALASSRASHDKAAARRLWDISASLSA